MAKTFKALSALLSYPTRELQEATDNISQILREENIVPAGALIAVDNFIDDLKRLDLYELQERYVFLFDRTRSLSLHLFEHVHGESRDRGQAMIDLQSLYARSGLEIDARELPDYLPLFLEFLSTRPVDEARRLLAEPLSVIAALRERLARRNTAYESLFQALEAIADQPPAQNELNELRAAPDDDPDDFEALDAAWEDRPVTFGPNDNVCPKAGEMLNRIRHAGETES